MVTASHPLFITCTLCQVPWLINSIFIIYLLLRGKHNLFHAPHPISEPRCAWPWIPFLMYHACSKEERCEGSNSVLLLMKRYWIKSFGRLVNVLLDPFRLQCRIKAILFPAEQVLKEVPLPTSFLVFFPGQTVILLKREAAILLLCWEPSGGFLSHWVDAKSQRAYWPYAFSATVSLHSLISSFCSSFCWLCSFLLAVPWTYQPLFCLSDFDLPVCILDCFAPKESA